jgi:hypothetical protein
VKREIADGTSTAGLWESRETQGIFLFNTQATTEEKDKAREVIAEQD